VYQRRRCFARPLVVWSDESDFVQGVAPQAGCNNRDGLPHIRSRMALRRNREVPKHVSATIQAELKRRMGELSGSNHAQLIRDTTAHLNSEGNTKDEFVGFDVLGGTMRIKEFQ
jgi:hypothetical protein